MRITLPNKDLSAAILTDGFVGALSVNGQPCSVQLGFLTSLSSKTITVKIYGSNEQKANAVPAVLKELLTTETLTSSSKVSTVHIADRYETLFFTVTTSETLSASTLAVRGAL